MMLLIWFVEIWLNILVTTKSVYVLLYLSRTLSCQCSALDIALWIGNKKRMDEEWMWPAASRGASPVNYFDIINGCCSPHMLHL